MRRTELAQSISKPGINRVRMLDLGSLHAEMSDELGACFDRTIMSSRFVTSEWPTEFEVTFAGACNKKYAVGVASGTAALWVALRSSGVGPGSEVITVPNSFFATTESIYLAGASARFADVDPRSHLLDIRSACALLNERTRAVLPVHLFGHVLDVTKLRKELDRRGRQDVVVIEDCAHACLSSRDGCPVPIGDTGTFSFNPGKNLGALGDAGAVVSDRIEVKDRAISLRDHCRRHKNTHDDVGCNFRLDCLNATVLAHKLPRLDGWNQRRREVAQQYDNAFALCKSVDPVRAPSGVASAYHQYVLRTTNRTGLIEYLANHRVDYGVHYPSLISDQPAMRQFDSFNDPTPVAAKMSDLILSLPCHPMLTDGEVQRVITAVLEFDATQEQAEPEDVY